MVHLNIHIIKPRVIEGVVKNASTEQREKVKGLTAKKKFLSDNLAQVMMSQYHSKCRSTYETSCTIYQAIKATIFVAFIA